MTLTEDFCLQRAAAAAAVAASSTLANVRAQQLSAEAAWRKMGAQAGRIARERAEREAARFADALAHEDTAPLAAVD